MTNDTLSSDVAVSLRRRAALVDPAAAGRIAARVADARPRSHRRFALAGSAAGAAGIGAVVAAAVTLSGATPAFAGWTASPSSAPAADAASATAACANQLASMPGGSGNVTWTPTATDLRGPYVLEALASGSMSATCLTGPSVTSVSFGGGGSLSSSGTPSGVDPGGTSSTTNYAPGDAVTELTLSSLDAQNGAPFDTLEGTVAPGVTAVSLALSDGQSVQATVNDGLVLAWWPNGSQPVTAQVTTASGTTTESLGTFGPGPGAIVRSKGVGGAPGSLHVNKSSADGGLPNEPLLNGTAGQVWYPPSARAANNGSQ